MRVIGIVAKFCNELGNGGTRSQFCSKRAHLAPVSEYFVEKCEGVVQLVGTRIDQLGTLDAGNRLGTGAQSPVSQAHAGARYANVHRRLGNRPLCVHAYNMPKRFRCSGAANALRRRSWGHDTFTCLLLMKLVLFPYMLSMINFIYKRDSLGFPKNHHILSRFYRISAYARCR